MMSATQQMGVFQQPANTTPIPEDKNMAISNELLEILACPKCKGDIQLNEHGDGLICNACRLLYPIRDDIPIMLIDEATPLA
jgi:uncharacterized protein YbaR (Trm112 family)